MPTTVDVTPQGFTDFQQAVDKANVVGVDPTSLYIGNNNNVYGTDPQYGLMVLGRMNSSNPGVSTDYSNSDPLIQGSGGLLSFPGLSPLTANGSNLLLWLLAGLGVYLIYKNENEKH